MMLRFFLSFLVFLGVSLSQEWFTDLQKGLEVAKKEGKLVLIYFYAEHCPYCYQVEEFVFGDPDVEKFLGKNFVVVSIDYGEDEKLSEKLHVFGTPTFVILDPKSGQVLKKIFGSVPKEQFMSMLTNVCNKSSLRRC